MEAIEMRLSQHAQIRSQQRGISPFVIDLLFKFGVSEPAGGQTERLFFDKRSRKRVASYTGGRIKATDEGLDVYAIVAGPKVITTGHRLKKIHRH